MQATKIVPPAFKPTVERRSRARCEYWVPVRLRRIGSGAAEPPQLASSLDISVGGMRLELVDIDIEFGQRVELEIELPLLRAPARVEAEVRWVVTLTGVCGVQFMTGLRASEVWAIQRLVRGE